jgi:hypothetical protein
MRARRLVNVKSEIESAAMVGSAWRRLHITAGVALVDDQQLRLAIEHQALGQLAVGLGFGQRRQERRRAREEHAVPGLDDRVPLLRI